jgi:outer membrane protein TolC
MTDSEREGRNRQVLPFAFCTLPFDFVLPTAFCLLPAAFCLLLFAGACTIGPKYARPTVAAPPAYKELTPTGPQGEWKTAQPHDQSVRDKWWEIFGDPQLNALEERIEVSNQNLKIVEAQFRQARDLIGINRSGLFPAVSTSPSIMAEQTSKNAPQPAGNAGQTLGDFVLPFHLSYEVDAWGRIHRAVEAARESAWKRPA